MANFTVAKVSSKNLNRVPIIESQMIFVPDTKEIYFDYANERVSYCQPEVKTFAEWLDLNDKVYPAGTLLVYTDRTSVDGENIPDMKIADGARSVEKLPFLHENSNVINFLEKQDIKVENGTIYAKTFEGALGHKLTIGTYVYDGSEDVIVPVYEGENNYS